jgi:hypothetical protein
VVSHQNLTGYGKAGIIVRNDITASGTGPEGVILFESPSGGLQLEWDDNGGTHINAVTPPNGTIADRVPVWLKLVRNGSTYTGYYSTDGTAWTLVGTADVPPPRTPSPAVPSRSPVRTTRRTSTASWSRTHPAHGHAWAGAGRRPRRCGGCRRCCRR